MAERGCRIVDVIVVVTWCFNLGHAIQYSVMAASRARQQQPVAERSVSQAWCACNSLGTGQ